MKSTPVRTHKPVIRLSENDLRAALNRIQKRAISSRYTGLELEAMYRLPVDWLWLKSKGG